VFGCAYRRIADEEGSATTLRRRRDEWIARRERCGGTAGGGVGGLRPARRTTTGRYGHRLLHHESSLRWREGGQESPVDRGKRGTKRSVAVDADGIPLGTIVAPANRHDSPLLAETLDAATEALGPLPERVSIHLDRGYDSDATRKRLEERGLIGVISGKGKPAPLAAARRWVVERTNSWHNAHKKLVWCTERRGRVIDFWIAFSEVVIIVRRLIREAWSCYRWEARPPRRP
jgi:IS5 family transposase